MRYPVTFNTPSKIILGMMGAGPSRSWIEVTDETVEARLGALGRLTIDRKDIATIEDSVRVPWWMGMGMHAVPGTVALNGSLGSAIKITMKPGTHARGMMLFFPIRPHTVYVSVENPEDLAYHLGFGPR
jgi:hypothetical protein